MADLFYVDASTGDRRSYSTLFSEIGSRHSFANKHAHRESYETLLVVLQSLLLDQPLTLLPRGTADTVVNLPTLNYPHDVTFPALLTLLRTPPLNWSLKMSTSGTTGVPKSVTHRFETLTKNLRISNRHREDVWGLTYPPDHMAGLQVFFQAVFNQNPIVDLYGADPAAESFAIKEYRVTHLSGTPTYFRLLSSCGQKFPGIRRVTFGGEKFDDSLHQAIKRTFPNAAIKNIYASTEAGSLLVSDGSTFGFPHGREHHFRIVENELWIHRSELAEFEGASTDDWYHTNDMVSIVQDKPVRFLFCGRKNDMINVGGNKVNPSRIKSFIDAIPGITASKVYAKSNSVTGNVICADIMTTRPLDEKTIRQALMGKIEKFEMPVVVNFVDQVDTTRSGKIQL